MSSCILFHGPGARAEALEEAYRIGHLMAPPMGDDGLKVDEAREAVSLLQTSPLSGVGCLVIGPMDYSNKKSSDVLLKVVEEFDGEYVHPILWAKDLEDVHPTLRSRCLDRWVWVDPADLEDPDEDDDELEHAGRELVRASLSGELWLIPELVTKQSKKLNELLEVMANAIAADPTVENLTLWESLRQAARYRNPTAIEIIAACLP